MSAASPASSPSRQSPSWRIAAQRESLACRSLLPREYDIRCRERPPARLELDPDRATAEVDRLHERRTDPTHWVDDKIAWLAVGLDRAAGEFGQHLARIGVRRGDVAASRRWSLATSSATGQTDGTLVLTGTASGVPVSHPIAEQPPRWTEPVPPWRGPRREDRHRGWRTARRRRGSVRPRPRAPASTTGRSDAYERWSARRDVRVVIEQRK